MALVHPFLLWVDLELHRPHLITIYIVIVFLILKQILGKPNVWEDPSRPVPPYQIVVRIAVIAIHYMQVGHVDRLPQCIQRADLGAPADP